YFSGKCAFFRRRALGGLNELGREQDNCDAHDGEYVTKTVIRQALRAPYFGDFDQTAIHNPSRPVSGVYIREAQGSQARELSATHRRWRAYTRLSGHESCDRAFVRAPTIALLMRVPFAAARCRANLGSPG